MTPQDDIISWTAILILVIGLFFLGIGIRDWLCSKRDPNPGPVRLSEILRRRS